MGAVSEVQDMDAVSAVLDMDAVAVVWDSTTSESDEKLEREPDPEEELAEARVRAFFL